MWRAAFNIVAAMSLALTVVLLISWTVTGKSHLYKGEVNLHYYKVTPLTLVLPLCWAGCRAWSASRRRDRLARGLCVHCGYDLRATPQGCPECGEAPAASQAFR